MTFHPNELLESLLAEAGLSFAPYGAGEMSYSLLVPRQTIHAVLREVAVSPAERRLDRGRALLQATHGRRIQEIIRAAEPIADTPSLLILTSANPSDLKDAPYFLREGLYGNWKIEGHEAHPSSPEVRTPLQGKDPVRQPRFPSAVAILRPGDPARLDVYHNRHAAHSIHLEELDAGNVRHFRLSEDGPGMTVGWEKASARDP